MKRPVFINFTVDRFSAGCAHAQTDLDVPIGELCTLCTFRTFKRASEKDEVRLLTRTRCSPRQGVFHDYSYVFVL